MYTNNQGCIVCNVVPFFPMRDQFPLKILVLKIILIYKYRSILHCGQRTHKNKKTRKKTSVISELYQRLCIHWNVTSMHSGKAIFLTK